MKRKSEVQVRNRTGTPSAARPASGAQDSDMSAVGFTPFSSLRREVDALFTDFTDRFSRFGDGHQLPALDIAETEDAYQVRAEMPGVEPSDIDITAEGNRLTICGEKDYAFDTEDANTRVSECAYGHYERSVELPTEFKADAVRAEYANGVLQLNVPKSPEAKAKARKVKITSLKKS